MSQTEGPERHIVVLVLFVGFAVSTENTDEYLLYPLNIGKGAQQEKQTLSDCSVRQRRRSKNAF